MTSITIEKRDHNGAYVLSYTGEVLQRAANCVVLQAYFALGRAEAGPIVLEAGDLMTEWFYSDRYYNVFMIQQGEDGHVKGWYCNVTRPAEITTARVASDDLALDLVVLPSGAISVLDEAEFNALHLTAAERQAAWDAVAAIRHSAGIGEGPFQRLKATP